MSSLHYDLEIENLICEFIGFCVNAVVLMALSMFMKQQGKSKESAMHTFNTIASTISEQNLGRLFIGICKPKHFILGYFKKKLSRRINNVQES